MLKHIPNILTVMRIILVPFFPIAYLSDSPNNIRTALIIFIIAGLTDILDGFLARHFKLVTKLGSVLDPLADKFMLLTAVFTLYFAGDLHFVIPLIITTKELFMIIMGIILYFKKEKAVIPANKIGKTGTVLYSLAVFITVLFPGSIASWTSIFLAIGVKIAAIISYAVHYNRNVKPKVS